MSRLLMFFMAVWLGGFAAAAVTAPDVAPAAVITGTAGLLLTLACVAVRVSAETPSVRRRRSSVGGTG